MLLPRLGEWNPHDSGSNRVDAYEDERQRNKECVGVDADYGEEYHDESEDCDEDAEEDN